MSPKLNNIKVEIQHWHHWHDVLSTLFFKNLFDLKFILRFSLYRAGLIIVRDFPIFPSRHVWPHPQCCSAVCPELIFLMATRNNKHVSYNHFLISESMPLLIIISAAIGGFLIAIVAIVIAMTAWKINKKKSDSAKTVWPKSDSHQMQADRVSNSSQESNMQSSNTTSSLSTVDDLEGEFHEYHGPQYSRPGTGFIGSDNSVKKQGTRPGSQGHSDNYNNYSDYRHFRSEAELLDHAKMQSDYHNPYLQTITPTSDYNGSGNSARWQMAALRQSATHFMSRFHS